MTAWPAPASDRPVHGTVTVPGSKSLTNRYLLLAALAEGPSTLRGPLVSRDTLLMLQAVQSLGVQVERSADDARWTLTPPATLRAGTRIDCGLAGTVIRFVPPVAALADGEVAFDGDAEARVRPVGPLLDGLRQLGIRIEDDGRGTLPFTVHGTGSVRGGEVQVDASASSQFVSALLLAGARFTEGLLLRHTGASLPSVPHIDMTLQVLREAGVRAARLSEATWVVDHGPVHGLSVRVEPDLSTAAPLLAAAAVTGGQVTLRHWPEETTQGGAAIRVILEQFGARTEWTEDGLTVDGPGRAELRGVDLDLHEVGELTPVVTAVAALAQGPSVLRGVAHLRGHETDRLAALEAELGRMGCGVEQTPDGLRITPAPLRPAVLQTYHDHRMAQAAAVLGLAVPGTEIENVETTDKTFPGFAAAWTDLVHG